jgi:predicted nucleic acid-binding protein
LIPASHYSGVVKEEILKKKIALADLEEIEAEKEDVELSRKIIRERGLHFPDSLHAALAIRARAIIVTRTKHFELVKNLVEVRKPEDLL